MSSRRKLPKNVQARLNREEYKHWKKFSLGSFGFFPIFQPLKESFKLRDLSGNALRIYLYLGLISDNESGETWVSIETMAKYFGKSKRTISGWLQELQEAELIERLQLEKDGVAHTFLRPYGMEYINDENSMQKSLLKHSNEPQDNWENMSMDLFDDKDLF